MVSHLIVSIGQKIQLTDYHYANHVRNRCKIYASYKTFCLSKTTVCFYFLCCDQEELVDVYVSIKYFKKVVRARLNKGQDEAAAQGPSQKRAS